jgi:hypothetical protein
MATSREEIHRLVGELPDEALAEAARALRRVRAPRRRPSLEEVIANAPVDDESLTDDERAAIAEARADLAADRLVSDEDIRREFGIRPSRAPVKACTGAERARPAPPWPANGTDASGGQT